MGHTCCDIVIALIHTSDMMRYLSFRNVKQTARDLSNEEVRSTQLFFRGPNTLHGVRCCSSRKRVLMNRAKALNDCLFHVSSTKSWTRVIVQYITAVFTI